MNASDKKYQKFTSDNSAGSKEEITLQSSCRTLNIAENTFYMELPYVLSMHVMSEQYVSTEEACFLRELPLCMGLGIMSFLATYIARQQINLVKRTPKKIHKKPVTLLAPYMKPLPGTCSIEELSDEILIIIFSQLDSQSLIRSSRVCKRWNLLSKDKSLWRDVDLSFQPLVSKDAQKLIREKCNNQYTKQLCLSAREKSLAGRLQATGSECISLGVVREINDRCLSLETFYLSHDLLFNRDLLSHLPSTLKHLSLPYCSFNAQSFKALLSPGFILNELTHLDLTGSLVVKLVQIADEEWVLPPKLTTLIIRDTLIPLYDSPLLVAIADHKPLLRLDISLCKFSMAELEMMSRGLTDNLEVLNMAGCLICDDKDFTVQRYTDLDELETEIDMNDSSWIGVFFYGFHNLHQLNVRNVRQHSGKLMCTIDEGVFDGRSTIWDTIDTDGVILDEEGTEWSDRDCCEDPLENSKYSLEKRRAKEYVDLMEIHLSGERCCTCPYQHYGLYGDCIHCKLEAKYTDKYR